VTHTGRQRAHHRHAIGEAMELTFGGTRFSEPNVPLNEWDWTPTYVELPPETRGVVDIAQAPVSGNFYDITAYGGAISGTTAAKSNLLKNANMSRGAMFWTSSTPAPTVFAIDVLTCPRAGCGGKLRATAAVLHSREITLLLHGARGPPKRSHPGQLSFVNMDG